MRFFLISFYDIYYNNLYIFTDQFGQILYTRIVPDDTRQHVLEAVKKILATAGRNIEVEVIYTDDWQKDHKILQKLFVTYKLKVTFCFIKGLTLFVEASYLPRYMAC
jgi:hypothetical protein